MKKYLFLSLLIVFSSSVQALSIAPPDESFIYKFDNNGDHKLNLKEFLAVKRSSAEDLVFDFPITQQSFKKLDRNKNGFLDEFDNLPIAYTQEIYDYIQCWPRCEQK
ncbi:hypothetical protein [Moraxella sp. ZY210820]|uniref:hypothetical protein n=1 Tax=unclassified Moraxella TaxID=2685852 RepID=UPI00273027E8|nr:hypothetical protein [Moraxella sp. ZY210820]WLF84253.1 hypothetical protein LU301_01790 [Moraxella sp. ZY210820]